MSLSIIVAIARNHVIGRKNQLPWHLSEDLKHFKEITMGHPVIMGDVTFRSIGKPLPGRENVVISLDKNFSAEGVKIVHSLDEVVALYQDKEAFIIGGAQLYKAALPFVEKVYLTHIDQDFEGDSFLEVDWERDFEVIEKSERFVSEKDKIPYQFLIMKRRC